MKSVIYDFNKDEFTDFINESESIRECLNKLGLRDVGANRSTFKKAISRYSLDYEFEKLKERARNRQNEKLKELKIQTPFNEVFCENSKAKRNNVKKRILKEGLIEYKCNNCGIGPNWNNKKLSLHLDHINGISNDNRLENLRFLCPNCHSQTETYCGRRKYYNNSINTKNNFLIEKRKKDLEEINIFEYGWVVKVAKIWKCSHTQVKRWINKNIPGLEYYERN